MYIFSLTAAVNKTGLEKNFLKKKKKRGGGEGECRHLLTWKELKWKPKKNTFLKKKKKGGEMQTFADMKRTKVKTKEK